MLYLFGFGANTNIYLLVYFASLQINALFELVDKIDPLVSLAPVLVTRLKGLKGLHAEAAVFSDSIKMISSEQTKITEELKGLDTVSAKVTLSAISVSSITSIKRNT